MQILTDSEYESIVSDLASRVFDPMHANDAVADASLDVIEKVNDGRQDEAREDLREEMDYVVHFGHDIHDNGPLSEMDAATAGCIIQHGDKTHRVSPADVDASTADTAAKKMAAEVLYQDVKTEVHERVRAAVEDD